MYNKKFIIFDVDGTLFSSIEVIIEAFRKTFQEVDEPFPSDDEVKKWIGTGLYHILGQFLPPEKLDKGVEAYKKNYREMQDKGIDLVPYTQEALINLHQNQKKIAAFTMKQHGNTQKLFEIANIDQYFEYIVGADDIENFKPDPEGLLKILDFFMAEAKEAVFVGDSLHDAFSAQNAKMDFIAVLTGSSTQEEFERNGFNTIFHSVKEVGDFLLKKG